MTDAPTYADLERRYTGPIPKEALDRLRYGSATEAEIARTEDQIAFFRDLICRTRISAKKWFMRGNLDMARQNMGDSWWYLNEWRFHRRRLVELREQAKTLARLRAERAQVRNAKRILDMISGEPSE